MQSVVQKYGLPVAVLIAALIIAWLLLKTPPQAHKGQKVVIAPMVDVVRIEKGSFPVLIQVMGQVIPAKEIELVAQVSGEIVEVSDSFVSGGIVRLGQSLLKIDPQDYQLELDKQKAAYEIELGQQQKARKDLEILRRSGSKLPKDQYLILRGPQLKQAEIELQKAKLSLDRTNIKAPFNAMVVKTNVNLGAKATAQQALATLVGTDEYWVQLSVPVDQIQWVLTGEHGSHAEIRLNGGRGAIRNGRVARIVGQLQQSSRLAPVIVSIDDPLQLAADQERLPPLLLGDYVDVTVHGKELSAVYRTPHHYIRNGNIVWTARAEKMVFIPVDILHKDREYTYFKADLIADERIVISEIATPVDGMTIEVKDNTAETDHTGSSTVAHSMHVNGSDAQ